jgi:phosphoribosylanthranilate isomerase
MAEWDAFWHSFESFEMEERVYVKICGVTRVSDAVLCVEAGASAIGLNFVPTSKRCIDEETARDIVTAVAGRLELVAVVAGLPVEAMKALRARTGVDVLQLHGDESAEDLAGVLPGAMKAVHIDVAADARDATRFGGDRLLADAKVKGELGGTGASFDWSLIRELARERSVIVAGGLTPENVRMAMQLVRPFGVDVASGVESSPGIKDPARVRAFIDEARRARSR